MSDYPWRTAEPMPKVAENPGVYLFRDAKGKVLYIGKARNLRARLATYRSRGGDGRVSVAFLERDARKVETIITRTEQEALLLEDALIKQYKPPHNVRLKDDKSFLMIRIDLDERFPRLKFVRAHRPKQGKKKGRSRFFGPYASTKAVRQTLSDLHRVVPLRDCTDQVLNHRSRPCLKHQLGLCSAPCVGLISEGEYAELVERAEKVLSGNIEELEQDLDQRMCVAAKKEEYELAAHWRDRLQALRRTVERQGVQPGERIDRDVLGLARSGDRALVHRLAFREGRLVESRSHAFRSELPDEELLHNVLTALYGGGRCEVPREIVVPARPADAELLEGVLGDGVQLVAPRGGARRRMVDVADENARVELARRESQRSEDEDAARRVAALVDLPEAETPPVIDCFDVSNLQGTHVVASRVRFRAGIPDRDGYRRFRVRTVEGQDDFASMREVVGRSLRRGTRDGDLPDLVVIDGGPQQLASALQAREDAGAWDVRIVSLAKARPERNVRGQRRGAVEERVYLAPESAPHVLEKHTPERYLLERIRNEAHRFAIAYHRKERGKIRSRLDSIPGVGPAKRKALLKRFGSAAGVEAASVEELAAVRGVSPALARTILEHLRAERDRK
ncbi:MAG: excinuclease ABC subunit UvrC [Planctomycetota bacterium]|nr:excinuclease ABC subunit UvrC [Planctomycetota bacterium]